MSKNKLQKFAELATFPNTYQNFNLKDSILTDYKDEDVVLKGRWNQYHFKNDNPITLELACGRGEYTVNLAQKFPERNFIGVDIKGARIWKGAKQALEQNLTNVAFLRTKIEKLPEFFERDEISEIWITFPDPFLKKSKANRRLTSSPFLNRYKLILKDRAPVHLKTDSDHLFEFTKEVLKEASIQVSEICDDIYAKELPLPELAIKTYYERMHLEEGRKIKYLRFHL